MKKSDRRLNMFNLFQKPKNNQAVLNKIANLIKVNKQALQTFEESYAKYSLNQDMIDVDGTFSKNSRMAAEENHNSNISNYGSSDVIISSIIQELLSQTECFTIDKNHVERKQKTNLPNCLVDYQQIMALEEEHRPMLTGTMMSVDISEPSSISLIHSWAGKPDGRTIGKTLHIRNVYHYRMGCS